MFRPGLVFAFAAAAFWLMLVALLPPALQIELLTYNFLPLTAVGLWRWGPRSLRNLFERELTGPKILTLAVATMLFAAAFQSIYRLVYLWLDQPVSMTATENAWASFPIYVFTISVVLYLLATRRETDPPMPTLLWVVGLGAMLLLLTGFAIRLFGIGLAVAALY